MDLIGTEEAARRLGIPPRRVKRMCADGRLPWITKGPGATGAYLIDPATVDALAAEQVTQ